MTFALIPAAGKSTRMGRPKLALPLGDRTVLEHVIAALREAGIEHILVVVGPHAPELAPLAEAAGAHVLLLGEETSGMRATVEQGLQWLEDRFHPHADDTWLLVPADHPALAAWVVRRLQQALAEQRGRSIVIPTYQGRRGHPTLIGWRHAAAIRALPPDQGINAYLRRRGADTLELQLEAPAILCDMDTPEDYERLRRGLQG
jgi:molybdenum cofactor cytidylyltransferase